MSGTGGFGRPVMARTRERELPSVIRERPAGGTGTPEVVRELQLRRRRSRVPWIFAVYHRRPARDGRSADAESVPRERAVAPGFSALTPEKSRNVER